MRQVNWNHLHYFWVVAREGSIARAAEALFVAPQTITGQLRVLEETIGHRLYQRSGRALRLTETGDLVFQHADAMFRLGAEMTDILEGRQAPAAGRFRVGVVQVLPKMVAWRLLAPALGLDAPPCIAVDEGSLEELLAALAVHRLDLVIADRPLAADLKFKAYNHLLGECGVAFFAVAGLAKRLRKGFPSSLEGAPMLLPMPDAVLRRELDQWMLTQGIRVQLVGEFADSALTKAFGMGGAGAFIGPAVLEKEICAQYGVQCFGRVDEVRERFYAITIERRISHPAGIAIRDAARGHLFSRLAGG